MRQATLYSDCGNTIHRSPAAWLLTSAFLTLTTTPSLAMADSFSDFRGLWISRFEYNEDSVSSIQSRIADAASLGITDVIWQVRGRADAYYFSNHESPAQGWQQQIDPLQVALDAAHANGMKLHAWLNTMPLWSSSSQPADPNHIWFNESPSFRVTDINGNVEQIVGGNSTFGGTYARINHVLPEVQTHINNVVNDLATNYNVDGIHLDYIRWLGPNGGGSEGFRPDWDYLPHDAYSHQLYFDETGQDASDGSTFTKREAYRDWVQGRITDLVSTVGQTVDAAEISQGREIKLSAAVWNNPTTAERDYMQDYRTWLQQDLLDIAIPMVYLRNSNNHLMDGFLNDIFSTPTNTDVSIGLGTYLHDASNGGVNETIYQLQKAYDAGADSATFFSYGSFFDSGSLGDQRTAAVNAWYDALVPTDPGGGLSPNADIITDFETDEGYFPFDATHSGSNSGILGATADRTTAEAHLGDYSQVITIDGSPSGWFLRHVAGIGTAADPGSNLPLESEGSIGFWLKTSDPGVSVRVAVDDPGTADRGLAKPVIADGQWRLYEWDLSDDSQWEGWVTGDGLITGQTVTLDSIQFFGAGDAVIYLDTVAHNPLGSLLAPSITGDYNSDGMVDVQDYAAWRTQYGASVTPGEGPDGNADGLVDAADYVVWRNAYANAAQPASLTSTPEPGCLLLLFSGVVCLSSARRR